MKTAALSCCSQPQPNTYKALVSMCVRACVRVMLGVCVCLCVMFFVCAGTARKLHACVLSILPQNHHTGDCRPCQWRIRGPRGTPESAAVDAGAAHAIDQVP